MLSVVVQEHLLIPSEPHNSNVCGGLCAKPPLFVLRVGAQATNMFMVDWRQPTTLFVVVGLPNHNYARGGLDPKPPLVLGGLAPKHHNLFSVLAPKP